MECPVCLEAWDLLEVRPKRLPCRHAACAACVESFSDRKCPTCRQVFADPVLDNFPLIAELKSSLELSKPLVSWCLSCKRPSSVQCVVAEHDVKRPKAALRRGLAGLATRCSQQLKGIEVDCLQDMQDGNALAALELLDAERAACKLAMTLDDGRVVSAEYPDDDAIAKMCLVAAAAYVQRVPPAPCQPQPVAQCDGEVQEPDFASLSKGSNFMGPAPACKQKIQKGKARALEFCRQREVRRIPLLRCHHDWAWSLDVLQLAGPTLEELHLKYPDVEHFAALRAMPRLQRLQLEGHPDGPGCSAAVAAPLHPGSLTWLRVQGLPEDATWSLLKGHAASLEVVWLRLHAVPGKQWPWWCGPWDLETQLRQCGLDCLQRLVLVRSLGCKAAAASCQAQLEAARRALQGCTVQCSQCDDVLVEDL